MAEGWACYATDLIAEAGGLTELELLNHRRSRVRMCARAIVDVELHNQRMTLDEAAEFYQESSGMAVCFFSLICLIFRDKATRTT